MKLTLEHLPAYLAYLFPERSSDEREHIAATWETQWKSGKRDFNNHFLSLHSDGSFSAALQIFPLGALQFGISLSSRTSQDPQTHVTDILALLKEACERLVTLKATRAGFRLTETPWLLPVVAGLPALGFHFSHVRLEFRAQVADLPDDADSPFHWKAVRTGGPFDLEFAGNLLDQAASGDPDWDAEDRGLPFLHSYLNEKEFSSNLDCIHIGSVDGEPAAIAIAQVNPSGWSRLTYMGLIPKFRGRGLGRWVHRHGFAMMKAQEGIDYFGGTVQGNTPMVALFLKHACEPYRTLQQWFWEPNSQ